MTQLSSAAQAVLDAYRNADIDDEASVAAVLRAAADQVVPGDRSLVRRCFLAIATELKGVQ